MVELESELRIAERIYHIPTHVHKDIERLISPFAGASEAVPDDVKSLEKKVEDLEVELAIVKEEAADFKGAAKEAREALEQLKADMQAAAGAKKDPTEMVLSDEGSNRGRVAGQACAEATSGGDDSCNDAPPLETVESPQEGSPPTGEGG